MKGRTKTPGVTVILAIWGILVSCAPANEGNTEAALLALGGSEPEQLNQQSIQAAFDGLDDGSFQYQEGLRIKSADGTILSANIYQPISTNANTRYPAVVFVNSWAMDEYEYKVPAAILAKKGYIALSYSTRGWGDSEGLVNVAGPKDMADVDAVLTWLENNTPVDSDNIAMAGISYGAGISMLALAQNERVKTAVAMSGWADLEQSLYGNETVRLLWGNILLESGEKGAQMDPTIEENFNRLLDHEDVDLARDWAAQRSVNSFIDGINAARKPLYISNNLQDYLFAPNPMVEFYQKLQGPKKLDLNSGIHATAEAGGLFGQPNYVWDRAYMWFDYWLKGEQNGIMDQSPVSIQEKFSESRDDYQNWPPEGQYTQRLYLRPGRALREPSLDDDPNRSSGAVEFYNGTDTSATTGERPLIAPLAESELNIPVELYLPSVSNWHGEVFRSETYWSGLKIRGVPKLKLRVKSDSTYAQFVVYLYEREPNDWGTLITHGVYTLHDLTPGQTHDIVIDLSAISYDLSRGSQLALAVDTYDALYANQDMSRFKVSLELPSSKQSVLEVPVTQ